MSTSGPKAPTGEHGLYWNIGLLFYNIYVERVEQQNKDFIIRKADDGHVSTPEEIIDQLQRLDDMPVLYENDSVRVGARKLDEPKPEPKPAARDNDPLAEALIDLRDHGYQPQYNGRPSCPFCQNFIDEEETHTPGCVLVKFINRMRQP